jgi:hypothetical protein
VPITKLLYSSNVVSFAGSSKCSFRAVEASWSRPSKRLVYSPGIKHGTVLEKLTNILLELFGADIFSHVLLGPSSAIHIYKKEHVGGLRLTKVLKNRI